MKTRTRGKSHRQIEASFFPVLSSGVFTETWMIVSIHYGVENDGDFLKSSAQLGLVPNHYF